MPASNKSNMDPYPEMRLLLNKISNKTYLVNIDRIVDIYIHVPEEEISEFETKLAPLAVIIHQLPAYLIFDSFLQALLATDGRAPQIDPHWIHLLQSYP